MSRPEEFYFEGSGSPRPVSTLDSRTVVALAAADLDLYLAFIHLEIAATSLRQLRDKAASQQREISRRASDRVRRAAMTLLSAGIHSCEVLL